ncbi:MAG: hypothetical protein WDN49_14190 [Acetobacteraceae bacterium]
MRDLHEAGTRIRLFPELGAGYVEPETALLSPPPGAIGPGPEDDQFYVANAVFKPKQYEPPSYMPPYRAQEYRPAAPSPSGHFDHIPVDAPEFLAAHIYGAARHTLDIWEHYLRRRVQWWHAPEIPKLELVPVVDWANAHSGPGFLETGVIQNHLRQRHMFCLNFDVIAHEVGHAVLFAQVGVPAPGRMTSEYLAFHESFSDLFGVIGVLRFESVIQKLLQQTQGNLYVLNLVSRLGAYSDTEQVRIASTQATMADVAGVHLLPDGNWADPAGLNRNQHALGEPLTGAIFDSLVELYQDRLVSRGLIRGEADGRGWRRDDLERSLAALHRESARGLARLPHEFHNALLEARDVIGFGMAHAMKTIHPDTLTFERVAARILEAAWSLGERTNVPAMLDHFLRHGIDPRPFLAQTHAGLQGDLYFIDPFADPSAPRCQDPAAFIVARRLMRHEHREIPR